MRNNSKLYMAPAGTKHPISVKDLENWVEVGLRTPLASWQRNVLGQWAYTPQDELRDRLNDRLQGKDPAPVINTRFWRGL